MVTDSATRTQRRHAADGGQLTARARLLWAALRFRARASAALFLLAVGAALAAGLGPIFLSAADGSVLDTTLRAAAPADSGLSVSPAFGQPDAPAELATATDQVPRPASGPAWYGAPIDTVDAGGIVGSYSADLVARTGACARVHITAGHCPNAAGEVLLSTRSAAALGVHVGQQITLTRKATATALRVAGTYLAGDAAAPYWWGSNYFPFGLGVSQQHGPPPPLDALFTTPATVVGAAGTNAQFLAQLPLIPEHLRPVGLPAFDSSLARYEDRLTPRLGVSATSHVGAILATARSSEARMATVVGVVALQLVLLALLVLYTVAARTSEAREPELALAALRGMPVRATFGWAMLEPAVLLFAAMPVGLLLAWGVVTVAAPHLLPAGTGTGPTWLAVGAVVLTMLAAAATLATASRRLLRPTLAGDLQIGLAGPRWRATGVEGAVLALAVAALVELLGFGVSRNGRTDALAAFVPGLIALALGLLARRLLPAVAKLGVQLTAFSRRVAAFLAVRQIARRAAVWRQLVELTVAVGLLTFAINAWFAAAAARSVQAEFVTGADRVVTVQALPADGLIAAVRAADPGGRQAMAVVRYSSPSQLLLAVDSTRLARVGSWPAGVSPLPAGRIAALLHPRAAPTVDLAGSAVRLVAAAAGQPSGAPDLGVYVFDTATQSSARLDLGPIRAGTHTYTSSFDGLCGAGCRLSGIGPIWPAAVEGAGQPVSASLSLNDLQELRGGTWRPLAAGLTQAGRWAANSAAVATATPGGLTARFTLGTAEVTPTVRPADAPSPLPAILTPELASANQASALGNTLQLEGLDGAPLETRWAATATSLPSIGTDAALVDLDYAALSQTGAEISTTDEVWLSATAPASILTRLRAQGLAIGNIASAQTLDQQETHDGAALADLFLLMAAVVAALLAGGTSLVLLVTEGRQRGAELAALRAAGVPSRALHAAALFEQAWVLAAGALVGAAAGLLAIVLASSAVPLVSQLGNGPPLSYPVQALPVAIAVLAMLAVLWATGYVGTRVAMAAATPEALRSRVR